MRGNRGRQRRAKHAAMIGALLVVAALAGAAQASAATYHAFLCRVPYGPNAGKPAPTDGTTYSSNSAGTVAKQTCATGGSMSATVIGTVTTTVGNGASVQFTVPAGLAMPGFRLWRHERATAQASGGTPFTKAEYGSSLLEPDCNPGSGVHEGTLLVDGAIAVQAVLDPNGGSCANLGVAPDARPSFVNVRPCPAAVDGVLTVDTDALAPGPHTFTTIVGDAAGNQTVAGTTTTTVVGTLAPGTPNGVGASRDAKLSARFGTRGRRARTLGYRARPTISGRLVTAAGGPIAAATVDILVRDSRTGARTARIASARTDASGRFGLQLPSGPSRTISVRYTAFSGDPRSAASARLRALVRAQLTAAASPRSVRVGAPLRISGRLRHLRRASVLVTIQVRESTGWRTFDTVKTRKNGRYRWTHRFRSRALAGRRVAFRARVDSPIYPFEPGTSRVVRVRFR